MRSRPRQRPQEKANVGAGLQPAQAIPQVENLRPLQQTCGSLPSRGCRFATCTSTTLGLDSPQVENLRPLRATCGHFGRSKNAAADGTPVDAARGQALASHSSCHRAFRSRSRMSHGQASFAVRLTQMWWLSPFSARAQAAARRLRASRRQPSIARPIPTTAIDEGSGTTARTPVVSSKVNCWPPTVAVEVHSEPDLVKLRPL